MPGIGKTTSIHCLAHALLGDAYKEGVLELNASDERYVPSRRLAETRGCSAERYVALRSKAENDAA